jgi:3-oxoacyl-[acyl-carrier protein] reductase
MDLGIAGRKAIVCASSRGLGRACAERLSVRRDRPSRCATRSPRNSRRLISIPAQQRHRIGSNDYFDRD